MLVEEDDIDFVEVDFVGAVLVLRPELSWRSRVVVMTAYEEDVLG